MHGWRPNNNIVELIPRFRLSGIVDVNRQQVWR